MSLGKICIYYFFISFLFFFSCTTNENLFSIEGRLHECENDEMYVIYLEPTMGFFIDTIPVGKTGVFKITGEVDSLSVLFLMKDRNNWTPVFIDKGYDVKVTSQDYSLGLAEVKGGKMNNKLNDFKKKVKTLQEEKCNIESVIRETFREQNEVKEMVFMKHLGPKLINLNHALGIQMEEYIKKNPEEIVSVVLLLEHFCKEKNLVKLNRTLSLLRGSIKDHYITSYLETVATKMQEIEIGQTVPDFKFATGASLSDFSGQYVLLYFWSCDEPFSNIHNKYFLYDFYLGQMENEEQSAVAFLGICLDENLEDKQQYTYTNIYWTRASEIEGLNTDVINLYRVFTGSKNLLINPYGVIIAHDVKSEDIKNWVKR
ncbi:MAG: DUF4369 domain-containing protein [Candidatus Azobacteroides sp.]|nr:DUF4369 domain-containing protein [Candidatus Azobacteroides sp.]